MNKKLWFFIIALLLAAGGLAAYYFHHVKETNGTASVAHFVEFAKNLLSADKKNVSKAQAKDLPIPVFLAKATVSDVPFWIGSPANVQPYNSVNIRPRVSGPLDTVNFTEGQMVEKGDILAQIDPRSYQAVVAQARAKKIQDEVQLKNAREELERIRPLVEEGAESQRLLSQYQADVARLDALVQADQAVLDNAQLDLDFTTLRTPIAGRTGVRRIDAGNTVTANQEEGLVMVTQTKPISAIFGLSRRDFGRLRVNAKPGEPFPIAQAVIEEGGKILETLGLGQLEVIDNLIDSSTDTIRLKAKFPNEDEALWPGQYITVRVLVETRKNAIVVPAPAVIPGLNGHIVYVVKDDNTVEMREVKVAAQMNDDGMLIVEEGLKAGETVVREGQNKLKNGIQVQEVGKADK
ncbi:MAG: efflux RND transporter periplasmic adaptor subunit [Puniceicoccales bacterium]|jgi:multidrug efflux system membrane fusion protein|nr:efflux RND transporter periplasmic adaptor subunit [Puniceicoccales bacterium]